ATEVRPCADSGRVTQIRDRRRCETTRRCRRAHRSARQRGRPGAECLRPGKRSRKRGQIRLARERTARRTLSNKSCLTPLSHCDRFVLSRIDPRALRLVPGIGLAIEGELQAIPQRTSTGGTVDDLLFHVIEADARDELNGPFEVPTLFP